MNDSVQKKLFETVQGTASTFPALPAHEPDFFEPHYWARFFGSAYSDVILKWMERMVEHLALRPLSYLRDDTTRRSLTRENWLSE
jgi:hypothetical protein